MSIPFTWTRIEGFPDDAAVALVHVAPVVGGPGAILTFKQHDQIRLAWLYGTTVKLLDPDIFEGDAYKDADGMAWLALDNKLYAVVSHAYGDAGSTARLAIGVADAPWAASAYSLLDNRIDARASALIQAALAGSGGSTDDQATIAALQATVLELEGRLNALQAALDGLRQRMGQAGAVLVGSGA